ncbi:hypothetical protein MIPYR_20182 [uncultured Microbacterium sp.]|uniref:Uncharacterized protein n=1 Tax=uncultured Microbacterium sp. TaxID=191216 RepID=A0A1Y5NZA0_9MICO|nr:hypothetical protein MIPYR_20182 [uncultured Microbacterium sp.]
MSANLTAGRGMSLVVALVRDVCTHVCTCHSEPRNHGIHEPHRLVYGSEGWEFESLRAHTVLRQ